MPSKRLFTLASEKMSLVSAKEFASWYIWRATGAMTKILSTNAKPVITWFGGTDWVPSALRRIESTTEIFTNDVSMITTKGARDRAARTMIMMTGFGSAETGPPMELDRAARSGRGRINCARVKRERITPLHHPVCANGAHELRETLFRWLGITAA